MIKLSDHFSYRRLLRFTWPSMMMFVSSVYCMVDGMMVSNYVGNTEFASLNLIWPFVGVLGAIGFMFGTGGSALVGKTLGAGNEQEARNIFSLLTYTALLTSIIVGLLGIILVRSVARLMGAEGMMVEHCQTYGSILFLMMPAYVMQTYFQSFLITAEKPKMGMWVTICAGVTNMVLDVLFIGILGWGLAGAAWATGLSQCLGGFWPLIYFLRKRKDSKLNLRLGRCTFRRGILWKTCSNGLSEFVINISLSAVSMLYMVQLLREAGENGVSAYGVLMYFAFLFVAIFLGFSIGCAPVVSYHYGAENKHELHNLLKKSMLIITCVALFLLLTTQALARPLASIFVGYNPTLLELTIHAFRIYMLHLLVVGINIYASAFFTALNNGPISALISLLRTMGFEALSVLLLPYFLGIEGIWWSVLVGEGLTFLVTIALLLGYRKRYGY